MKRYLFLMAATACMLSCAGNGDSGNGVELLDAAAFRTEIDGKPVGLYTLQNADGMTVQLTNYGARVVALWVPAADGRFRDVVWGYDSIDAYLRTADKYCGPVVGRFGNRIGKGRFTLDGKEYRLAVNNGPNHLHGGPTGFANRLWQGETTGDGVAFTRTSPDGEEGYPGTLTARIAYTWDDDCCLTVLLEAACDAPTIVNLTNHSYWNLAGENAGSVLGHELRLRASRWLPTDETLIPTGELAGVAGTPMDFRTSKPLGRDIRADFPALRYGKGYDNCWAVDDWRADEETTVAELYDPKSGRRLSVRSTQPGVQVYTGNWLAGSPLSKSGRPYADYDGVAIECQGFPDAPNRPDFPSAELRPGEAYRRTIRFRFDVR